MRFSIIVPVYNVEKYIKKCLESLVNQTFSDYEIVVVDDQTPDNSMQIVQTFADAKPGRIRVVHQQNKGLGGARNTGAAAATGEYILFIDSDDYIHLDTLKILNGYLEQIPCDILEFNYQEVTPEGKLLKKQTICDKAGVYSGVEERAMLILSPPIACNKAYRREFFVNSKVQFPEKTLYEDSVTRILVAKAEKIVRCTEYLYNYVQRANSIMHSNVSPRVLDIIKVADLVHQAFEDQGLLNDFGQQLEATLIASLVCVMGDVVAKNPKEPLRQELAEYTVKKFPHYGQNPFLTGTLKKKLACLAADDIIGYKKQDAIANIKSALLQFSVVRRMHTLVKRR